MFGLDMHIRKRTNHARSLDDVLRVLWKRYGAKGVPHPDDLQPVFEEATDLPLGEIFEHQIRGVEDPDCAPTSASSVSSCARRPIRRPRPMARPAPGSASMTGNKVTGVFDNSRACRHLAGRRADRTR